MKTFSGRRGARNLIGLGTAVGALVLALSCRSTAWGADGKTITLDARSQASIALPNDATPAEKTAGNELASYLGRVTGGKFPIVSEADAPRVGPILYVGQTRYARSLGLNFSELGPEEWLMQTHGGNLVLTGGRPRGSLYAVYHFLEDEVGVHWWNPYEESVPSQKAVVVSALHRRGQPAFAYRDIYTLYGHDGGRFAARSRCNGDVDSAIGAEYGGANGYGPPYHVHTAYLYLKPSLYFATHPEWFALVDGKRISEKGQLCFTDPNMRAEFLRLLVNNIRESRAAAIAKGLPPPSVYDVSQNDYNGWCECDRCVALVKSEGSQSGPMIDFVNFLADNIKTEFPGVRLKTLAYEMSEAPPNNIRPRDNVIVQLCNTTSNYVLPVTAPRNATMLEHIETWSKIAKTLRIWNYAVTYGTRYGYPYPSVQTYAPDYRFYLAHHVEGVFTELEYPIVSDARDYKVWMMAKLLEDPSQNPQNLEKTFSDGCYGAGGTYFRQYLDLLQQQATLHHAEVRFYGPLSQFDFVDLSALTQAETLFDQAENAVAGNPTFLGRIRFARLPLDREVVLRFPNLVIQWISHGGKASDMPLDRDAIANRYHETWLTQIAQRLPLGEQARERSLADVEFAVLTASPTYVPLPARFATLPAGTVIDYPASRARNYNDIVKTVPDAQAESKVTNRLLMSDVDAVDRPKYALPMPWGLYDTVTKKTLMAAPITAAQVPGPGYHWYKMGTFIVTRDTYAYFFWSWNCQFDLNDAVADRGQPAPFDVWASIKFSGPSYPFGQTGEPDAISIERLVLTSPLASGTTGGQK